MLDLAVVIVSFNTRDDLARTLASLYASPGSVPAEIVVVDNASRDGSAELAAACSGVQLIRAGGNLGFSRANNLGIRATRSEFILLLNSDTIVPPGALDRLVADLRTHPEAAVAGPRIVGEDGRLEISFGRMIGPVNELRQKLIEVLYARRIPAVRRWAERQASEPRDVDWVSGACLLVRRGDAEAVGLLDERFFLYTEDVDFCASVRALGRTVRYTPAAEIVHARGRSRRHDPRASNAAYRRSHLAFYEKHHPRWAPLLRLYLTLRGERPMDP